MNRVKLAVSAALITSISANIYLFKTVVDWQDAWLEQFLTTMDIEDLYKKSGADISLYSVKKIIEVELGGYKVVPTEDQAVTWTTTDEGAILFNGTTIYFKEGLYAGSKAKLPDHLVHWRFGQEEF